MTVTLRQRNKNGKISLYLDFYHKGKRKLEYLSLYLTEKPSTKEERALNKKHCRRKQPQKAPPPV